MTNHPERDRRHEVALKELEILQVVIARQDQFKEKTKALAVTLLTALTVGHLSGQITLSGFAYGAASIVVCMVFMAMEGIYGMTEIHAERRVDVIENYLRDPEHNNGFTTPHIKHSLICDETLSAFKTSIERPRTFWFYTPLAALTLIAAIALPITPSTKSEQELALIKLELIRMTETIEARTQTLLENNAKAFDLKVDGLRQALRQDTETALKQLSTPPKAP